MRVLVTLDDKPNAQAVLDALVKMHWYDFTEIVLLTVLAPGGTAAKNDDISAVAQDMEDLAKELRGTLRQCEIAFLTRSGDAKTVILETAGEMGADLIVLGSNCKSTVERLLLGSVCQSILNGARCPVIVAKTPCCLAREVSPGFRNILVPVDNSIFSDIAVRWLSNFSWAPETKFIITAVVPEDTDITEVNQSLTKRATDLAKWIHTDNIVIEIATGIPQEQIINLAKKHYADLIVMGAHGQAGIKELIVGSVSHSVSHASPCAVAIIRGLAGDEKSGRLDGSYGKAKPLASFNSIKTFPIDRRERDNSIHVMPAGM